MIDRFVLVDRGLRGALGLAALSMLIWVDGPGRFIGLLGLVPLIAAIRGRCPIPGVCSMGACSVPPAVPPQEPTPAGRDPA